MAPTDLKGKVTLFCGRFWPPDFHSRADTHPPTPPPPSFRVFKGKTNEKCTGYLNLKKKIELNFQGGEINITQLTVLKRPVN